MSIGRSWLFALLLTASWPVYSQDAPALLSNDALSSEDTLSIVSLIDSLLQLEEDLGSQLTVRLGYNSNVLSAGRTLGIQNFGLAPALSYYHRSGLYADVTAYWSKDFDPAYYLTVAAAGYMTDISDHLSIMAEYDHYFYNTNSSYIPYQNTLAVTPTIEFKPISLAVNYSYYFGDQTAHRIMPGLTGTFSWKNVWILDRVAILPSAYLLWGNETITTIEYVEPRTLAERISNRRKYGTPYSLQQIDKEVYGIMNYMVTLPVTLTYRKWSLILTYAYNIPKALAGEPLTISESSYLSGSLTYFIDLKRRKKLL
jgi:hypothetical protein